MPQEGSRMTETAPETTAPAAAAASEASQQDEPKTFDADYVKQLRAESAKYRTEAKANAEAAKRLAEIENANKTEQERAAEAQQQALSRAETAEARALRFEVAFEKGLTPGQAKRLTGSTREELEADAEEVLREFPASTTAEPRRGAVDQGVRRSTAAATPAEAFTDWIRSQK